MSSKKVRFIPNSADDFGSVLKKRVDQYFQTSSISKKANAEMLVKSLFYLGGFFALYFFILLGHSSAQANLFLVMLLGLFIAGIGFNISHDAIHESYSDHKWVNELLGQTFSILGANVFTWKIMHNIVHHSYTNIPEADGDLHSVSWLKFFKEKKHLGMHRYQHIYAFVLYGLTSLVWVFSKDYVHIGRKNHLVYERTPTPGKEYFWLVVFKSLYYFSFLILPMLVMHIAWWQVIIGFLAMHFVSGFALAVTFQLGHLVEGTEFPNISETGSIPETWIVHQLKTSANFSVDGFWASWIFGGLNCQIEHHLFPKICHVHYRYLAPIVRETALEFGLPYNEYPGFFSAVRSHLRYLKATGATA